jgi:uncharacterized protein (UPF0210 family)
MKIRSITCFTDPHSPRQLESLARLAEEGTQAFRAAGWEVQTTRLAARPFPGWLQTSRPNAAVQAVQRMEADAAGQGFAYLSIGPAHFTHLEDFALIPALISATRNTFVTAIMADAAGGVSLPAVRACGQIIAECAKITPDGFANLRFAALANVPAYTPFFPAAYHGDEGMAFALAVECADAAVSAFQGASSLAEARAELLQTLNSAGQQLSQVAAGLSARFGAAFKGLDFSLAPFPEDCCSLAGAMQALGVDGVGLMGALTAGAILADTLDAGSWLRAGFNGLMLPVLEDSIMAAATAQALTVKDLLLYSTVCGAGLDTVPLPGDASPEQLSALLLDVAALAVRLGKPLTARLMPVPGKSAGDTTEYDFGYFANGKIMALPARPLTGRLNGDETISLHPRTTYR